MIFIRSSSLMEHIRNQVLHHYRRWNSTIYALSSGQGKCGVAVIRISGPKAGAILKTITKLPALPEPRKALLKYIYEPNSDNILDKGLILWFPGPKSFTGEDCCELQIHGGLAVISSVLKALGSFDCTRLANPGEFTKRSFFAGKLDLTEVEGLADLLQAETEQQRKQAFLQTDGTLRKLYGHWKETLIKCVANVEAYIDFSETESLEDDVLQNTMHQIANVIYELYSHLNDSRKGEILRSGVKTVIVGEPNVGKSTLLNLLCKRPAAIVTPIAGTTRDLLEVGLDINGYPLLLVDTAGLRNRTEDVIEQEGINRALDSIGSADLIIFVIDAEIYTKTCAEISRITLTNYLNNLGKFESIKAHLKQNKKILIVYNKIDLLSEDRKTLLENWCQQNPRQNIMISCTKDQGVLNFLQQLGLNLELICGTPSKEHPSASQHRHITHLTKCLEYLQAFSDQLKEKEELNLDTVLMAEYLRKALREIGKITGSVSTEQVLDVIFKDFCIGK